MAKGDAGKAGESDSSALRVRLDRTGAPVGLIGPDDTEESAIAALAALGFVRATANVTGGITFSQEQFDAITPIDGKFYFVEEA